MAFVRGCFCIDKQTNKQTWLSCMYVWSFLVYLIVKYAETLIKYPVNIAPWWIVCAGKMTDTLHTTQLHWSKCIIIIAIAAILFIPFQQLIGLHQVFIHSIQKFSAVSIFLLLLLFIRFTWRSVHTQEHLNACYT